MEGRLNGFTIDAMSDLFLDHVLIAVNDLEQAGRAYSGDLGFTVTPRGSHPDRGTSNRLVVFPSEYLELITAKDVDRALAHKPDLVSFLRQRDGLFMFALGTRDINRTVESLRQRGLNVQHPTAGSRTPDSENAGYSWLSSAVDPTLTPGSATFLIQHDQTIAERYREPANPTLHRNGASGLTCLTLAVENAQAAALRWRQLFELPGEPASSVKHALGEVTRAAVRLGNCELEFVSPQGPGPLHDILSSFGEYPVMMSIAVHKLDDALGYLNSRLEGELTIVDSGSTRSCLIGPASTHGLHLLLVDESRG